MRKVTSVWIACVVMSSACASSFAADDRTNGGRETVIVDGIEYYTEPVPSPFQLTPEQQAATEAVLARWERKSSRFKNFSCRFQSWAYKDLLNEQTTATGTFCIDDQGRFACVLEKIVSDGTQTSDSGTQWIFDGKTATLNKPATKTITDSTPFKPASVRVPFVLHAHAKKLSEQFYIRILDHNKEKHQIHLQFYRKVAIKPRGLWNTIRDLYLPNGSDWRNYDHVDLILSDETFVPIAMQLHTDGHTRTAYLSSDVRINSSDTSGWFSVETPEGYKREAVR